MLNQMILLIFCWAGLWNATGTVLADDMDNPDCAIGEPDLGCADFGSPWQSGDQRYLLGETLVSDDIPTTDEFREAYLKPRLTSDEADETHVDSAVQLAAFQQELPVIAATEPSPAAEAQEVESGTPAVKPVLKYENKDINALRLEINNHREAISQDTQLSDAVKSSRLQILTSANEALLRLNESESKRIAFENQIRQIENSEQAIRRQLDQVIEPGQPEVGPLTQSETLNRELKDRQELLEQKKSELKRLENSITHHSERVSQIPRDRANANEQLMNIRNEMAEIQSDDLDSQLSLLLLDIKRRATEAELKKLDVEVRRQELGAKLDPVERDVVSREVNRLEVEITRWEEAARKRRDDEVREEQELANQAAETAHWSLKPLAERNAALIEEQKTTVAKLEKLKTERARIDQETESIIKRRTEIERKIDAAGLTGTNGMLLVDLRRNLMTTGESHIRIRQLQKELRAVNLTKVGLNEERDELTDPLGTVEQLVRSSDSNDPLVRKALQFVETKRDYLDQLIDDCQSYGRQLSEISESHKKLIDEINRTVAYIDTNALWVRSADPMHLSNFQSAGEGMAEFFENGRWSDVAARVRHRMSRRPYESALAVFSMFALFIVNRRVKQKLEIQAHEPSA